MHIPILILSTYCALHAYEHKRYHWMVLLVSIIVMSILRDEGVNVVVKGLTDASVTEWAERFGRLGSSSAKAGGER